MTDTTINKQKQKSEECMARFDSLPRHLRDAYNEYVGFPELILKDGKYIPKPKSSFEERLSKIKFDNIF